MSLMLVTQVTLITRVNTREIVGANFIVILIPNSTRVELQNETMDVPLGLRTTCDQLKDFPQMTFSRLASSAPRLFQEYVENVVSRVLQCSLVPLWESPAPFSSRTALKCCSKSERNLKSILSVKLRRIVEI